MHSLMDLLLVLLLLTNLLLLATSRMRSLIRIVALQGMAIGCLPFLAAGHAPAVRALLLGLGIIALKGFVMPALLIRAMRETRTRRELKPSIGPTLSLVIGILSLLAAFWISSRLPLPRPAPSPMVVPASLAMIFCGLYIIISRAQALTQVLGYLVLENGIYLFGAALLIEQPLLIEFGVLLDVFVAVFVMGIIIFHISREFDHIDTNRLSELSDAPGTNAPERGAP
ncbi:MAG: hydrogenase [Fibrobacterota bacterium]